MFGEILATEESDITTLSVRPGVVDTDMQGVIREKGKSTILATTLATTKTLLFFT